jgi:hypothetical protein
VADYIELRKLFSDDELSNRVDVAIVIAANGLLSGTPEVNDKKWAAAVFANPRGEGKKALMAVIATHNGMTVEQITSAVDSTLQTAVDAIVPSLVVAFTG